MPGQPDHDGDEPVIAVVAGDMALAVRRIGEAVQQHDGSDWRAVWPQDIGAIEILREPAGINRAAGKVSVQRQAFIGVEPLRHRAPDVVEYFLLAGQIAIPIGGIDLSGR